MQLTHSSERQPRWRIGYVRTYGEVSSKPRHNDGSIPLHTAIEWRYMPHDLPPWEAVYQQTQRSLHAGVFEEMVHDLRVLLRLSEGRAPDPTATILDSRTLQSTPESGSRGGYEGAKRKRRVRSYKRRWTHWDTSCSPCM